MALTKTLNTLQVTTPDAARATLDAHRVAFTSVGLEGIWPRIIALVVQPGVEFDHAQIIDYESEKAKIPQHYGGRLCHIAL